MPIQFFQNIKEESTNFPNTFCEVNRTLIPKPDKDKTQKREKYRQISLMNTDEKKNTNVNNIFNTIGLEDGGHQ